MNLKELKKEIPYKWKVQTVSRFKPSASCVAYIDARDVMDILDVVCGSENWTDEFKEIHGQMFCGISIKTGSEWVTKWDTGTEGSYEKEKSISSDSFKRAAVKWGIGRFLYSLKIRYVKTNEKKDDNNHPYPVGSNNKRIWNLTEHFAKEDDRNRNNNAPDSEVITDEQYSRLHDQCVKFGFNASTELKSLARDAYQIEDIINLPRKEFNNAMSLIERKGKSIDISLTKEHHA